MSGFIVSPLATAAALDASVFGKVTAGEKGGNDHIIDAVRCAMLAREQGRLDQGSQETVSLMPVLTEPLFI